MHCVESKINLIQGPTYEEMDGTLKVYNNQLAGKTLQMALNLIITPTEWQRYFFHNCGVKALISKKSVIIFELLV